MQLDIAVPIGIAKLIRAMPRISVVILACFGVTPFAVLASDADIQIRASCSGDAYEYNCIAKYEEYLRANDDPDAQASLGNLYTLRDKTKAKGIALIKAAAAKNSGRAYSFLADMYLNGDGVAKDPKQGLVLEQKAAALGSIEGMNSLAWLYSADSNYPEIAHDLEKSRYWHRTAVEHGDYESLCLLGMQYLDPPGTADIVLAGIYLRIGELHGSDCSKDQMNVLKFALGREGMKSVDAAARSWQPGTPLPVQARTSANSAEPREMGGISVGKPLSEIPECPRRAKGDDGYSAYLVDEELSATQRKALCYEWFERQPADHRIRNVHLNHVDIGHQNGLLGWLTATVIDGTIECLTYDDQDNFGYFREGLLERYGVPHGFTKEVQSQGPVIIKMTYTWGNDVHLTLYETANEKRDNVFANVVSLTSVKYREYVSRQRR